jgi:hypothetical protein
MPLTRILGESPYFNPEAVAILLEAYDGAVAELGLRTLAEKEKAARIVLQLALGQTDFDVAKLGAGATALMMRSESAAGCGASLQSLSDDGRERAALHQSQNHVADCLAGLTPGE